MQRRHLLISGSTEFSVNGNTYAGLVDAFVAKYSSSGALTWCKQYGTAADDLFFGVAVNTAGSVFTGGVSKGGLFDANLGLEDVCILWLDANGNLQ